MANKDDYLAKKAEAEALANEEVKTLYMPIGIFTQEAEDLYHWALKDKVELTAAGLPEAMLEAIPVLCGATREAQSIWAEDLKTRQAAEQEWAEKSPEAFDFKDQLVHGFRYAYRNNPVILTNVATIAEGESSADMIQDLNDLAVLGRKNPEPLLAIGVDDAQLEQAAVLSDQMADLRARANGEKFDANQNKVIRDKMYTLLKRAVDEVRDCGKYVFWRDKDRLKGYVSRYNQQTRGN
ncbi:hypothetical protein DMA11_13880 [Marinilabiliaceae bacterium JC017]|nr:hypothetical protein DMA11_13880 [Marinilabiliaceae bacterium JC017]